MTEAELIKNIGSANRQTYYQGIKQRAYNNMMKQHCRADNINLRNKLYRAEALANYKYKGNIYANYKIYNGKAVTIYTKFKFIKYMTYKQAYYYTYHKEIDHYKEWLLRQDASIRATERLKQLDDLDEISMLFNCKFERLEERR